MTQSGPRSDVRIIRMRPFYFITCPLPSGSMATLRRRDAKLVTSGMGADFFTLMMERAAGESEADFQVRAEESLQFTWAELHRRGSVSSKRMPEIIDGHPRDLLPKT